MNKFIGLFLGLDGRIARAGFCLGFGSVALILAAIVAVLVVAGFGETAQFELTVDVNGVETVRTLSFTALSPAVARLLALLAAAPLIVVAVKRRRDRGQSGLDVVAVAVLILLAQLQQMWWPGSPLAFPLNVVTVIWSARLLALMAFGKGNVGPNRYGPDPLAPTPPT